MLLYKMEYTFYEFLSEIIKWKKQIIFFLIKYYEIINYLKQLKQEKKIDTQLTKKYDLLSVQRYEKLIMSIIAEGNCVKYYAYNEKLFVHIEIVHMQSSEIILLITST